MWLSRPSEVAKAVGTPNNLREMVEAVLGRALRASRCAHESRAWARWARERGAGWTAGLAEVGGSISTLLAVEPQQSVFLRKLVGHEIPTNGRKTPFAVPPGIAHCLDCQRSRAIGTCGPD